MTPEKVRDCSKLPSSLLFIARNNKQNILVYILVYVLKDYSSDPLLVKTVIIAGNGIGFHCQIDKKDIFKIL